MSAPTILPKSEKKLAEQIISEECQAVGLSPKTSFELLAKLSTAKKMTLDKYGEEHFEEDNAVQFKVAEVLLKLFKLMDQKVEDTKASTIMVKVSPEDINRMETITKELGELQRRLGVETVQRGAILDIEVT